MVARRDRTRVLRVHDGLGDPGWRLGLAPGRIWHVGGAGDTGGMGKLALLVARRQPDRVLAGHPRSDAVRATGCGRRAATSLRRPADERPTRRRARLE